ncbi:hypothetical protein HNP46_004302 [Pseudomonas nitritireducens]|uniref:Uncharacterized protein n=1 Tax=Pseudomonas nitroreducens TaxID=46680 RepID=A0A7W7KMA8_PSENT|nr:hypothetical protein [Pseudomonas nitritireducens]MBB4865421.1 hypothetical protein [Pseudomonas nitritireducens]
MSAIKRLLQWLNPSETKRMMTLAGTEVGEKLASVITGKVIVCSGVEETDTYTSAILHVLREKTPGLSVLWQHSYELPCGMEISQIVHSYRQPGYEDTRNFVITRPVLESAAWARSAILSAVGSLEENEARPASFIIACAYATQKVLDEIRIELPFPMRFVVTEILDDEDELQAKLATLSVPRLLGIEDPMGTIPNRVRHLCFGERLAPC